MDKTGSSKPVDSKAKVSEPEDVVPSLDSGAMFELDAKVDGELGLIATVLGCRENRDRIEFAYDLKEFMAREEEDEE